MNIFGFIGLMRQIYGKRLPNLQSIERRGLLAVKIAQHYALRVDFLDERVCQHLSQLFRCDRPHRSESLSALLEDKSETWFNSFDYIDDKPFSSASVGQVHRASLKTGEDVVVKVLRDSYRESFLKDIRSLRRSLSLLLFFLPLLKKVFNPLAILDHIEEYTLQELDLRNEIAGAKELKDIADRFRDIYPLDSMKFPKHYESLSCERVLVAEYISGETFDMVIQRGEYNNLLSLFSLHGFFLFGVGLFHGDLHPGNVILGKDSSFYLIDTGALSRSGDRIRGALFKFFKSLCSYDFSDASAQLYSMSETEISIASLKKFEKDFCELYHDFPGKTVSEVSLTRKMMETIKLGVYSGMSFDQGMFPVIKSLMYLDGMVLKSNPDARLLEDMRPFIENFSKVVERIDESF